MIKLSKTRIIARIDIKNEYVIKGIQFDGLRKLGDPNEFAKKYYKQGADEIVFMDAVASLYDRNNLSNIIKKACEEIFIPITVGGGIRTINDIQNCLDSGADKVAINTQAIKDINFIKESSRIFGSQCIVGSIEAKKNKNIWEAYIDNGREKTGKEVLSWVKELQDAGCGEILLTSVDRDGTKKGFDLELCKAISEIVSVPLIISGGAGCLSHIEDLCDHTAFNAVAFGSMLHYNNCSIEEIKKCARSKNLRVRL